MDGSVKKAAWQNSIYRLGRIFLVLVLVWGPGFIAKPTSAAPGQWRTQGTMLRPMGDGGSMAYHPGLGGFIYAAKGNNTAWFYAYTVSGNGWFTRPGVPGAVGPGGKLLYTGSGNFIYALSGNSSTGFYKYSIINNDWTTLAVVPGAVGAGGNLIYPGSGDFIYATGGNGSNGFYKYSISNDAWTTLAVVPSTVSASGNLVYPGSGDFIYASKGDNSDGFYKYSISNDAWTTLAVIPANVGAGAGLVYPGSGDYIYASKGDGSNGFYQYKISTNTWATLTAAPSTIGAGSSLLYPGSGNFIYAPRGGNTDGFLRYEIDVTPPSGGTVVDSGQYTAINDSISASWSGFTDNGTIALYSYSAYITQDGSSLVAPTTTTNTSVNEPFFAINDGSTIVFQVQAIDSYSNSSSVISSNGITVDTTMPTTGIVTDEGSYSGSATTISASWSGFSDATSGIGEYSYSIGTSAGDTSILGWTAVGLSTSVTASGLTLSSGTEYVINVRAKDAAGNLGTVASSNGITVDTVIPTTGTVADDGNYVSNSSTILSASWSGFSDALSGISQYSYSIGTSAGDTSVRDWTSAGTATTVSATGLTLSNGTQYFVNVRAKDQAENLSTVVSSDGITVDTVAPTTGSVEDDGTYFASATTLSASWSGFSDAVSGIGEYSYSIGTSAGDTSVRNWTSIGTNTSVTATGLTLSNGTQYFINVRAEDAAGNLGTAASTNGITVDTAGPSDGTVVDDGNTTTNGSQLSGSWGGFADALSGISEYSYSIGTSAGDDSIKAWTSNGTNTSVLVTGLNLSLNSQYFLNVRAKDQMGNLGAVVSSNGIQFVDGVNPSAGTVSDTGTYTSSATTLHVSWSGFTDNVAVLGYEVSVGTSAGNTDIQTWTCVGNCSTRTASGAITLPSSYLITGLNLSNGTQYFINVRGVDRNGNTSTVVSTDGIVVDAQPPTLGTVGDEGQITGNGSQLSASWSGFADAISGVSEYSISIGTSAGDDSVKAWTSNGTNTSILVTGLQLVDMQNYFVNVRVRDTAGNLGEVISSDGIQFLADQEAPVAGTVNDSGQYTSSVTTLAFTWSGFSDNSTISSYEYSIGTSAGNTSVRDWTTAGNNNGFAASGLTLSSGTQYVINLRAKDIIGNTSVVISTDGITVDNAPPTGGVVTDEGSTTGNGTQLRATLGDFLDPLSGISEYSYSIGTSAGDESVKGWTSIGTSTTILATGLQLMDQQTYFINVRAKDSVGNIGASVSSNGITFVADASAPTGGVVMDEGSSTRSTSQLSASWFGFTDASGIAEYSYSIGTSAGDASVKTWTSNGLGTGVTVTGLNLSYGGTYFFNVRAKDSFGNMSATVSSDGIFIQSVGGDMDQDGDIDITDAQLANNFSTGKATPTPSQIVFADVAEPKDGKITTEDANLILRCAKGTIRGNPLYPWCPALGREGSED